MGGQDAVSRPLQSTMPRQLSSQQRSITSITLSQPPSRRGRRKAPTLYTCRPLPNPPPATASIPSPASASSAGRATPPPSAASTASTSRYWSDRMPSIFSSLRSSLGSMKSPGWPSDHEPMPPSPALVDRDRGDDDDARLMSRVAEGYPVQEVRDILAAAERHARDVAEQASFVREWTSSDIVVGELDGIAGLTMSMRADARRLQSTMAQYAALIEVLGLAQEQTLSRLEVADHMLTHIMKWVALTRARTHHRFADFDRTRNPTSPAPAPHLNIEYFATMLNELTSVEWTIDALQPAVDKITARVHAQNEVLARVETALGGAAATVESVLDGSAWHDWTTASDASDAAEASESGVPLDIDTPRLAMTGSTDAEDGLKSPKLEPCDSEALHIEEDEHHHEPSTTLNPRESMDLADVSKFVALHGDDLRPPSLHALP